MIKVIINFFCAWHCTEYSLCMCRDKAWIYVIQRLPSDKCYQVKRLIYQSRERFVEWVNWDSGQYNDYGTQYSNGWKSSIHSHLSSSMSMQMLASWPAWCLMAIGWLNWWLYSMNSKWQTSLPRRYGSRIWQQLHSVVVWNEHPLWLFWLQLDMTACETF